MVPVWVWWGVLSGGTFVIALLVILVLVIAWRQPAATPLPARPSKPVVPDATTQMGQKTLAYWRRVGAAVEALDDAKDIRQKAHAAHSIAAIIRQLDTVGVDEWAIKLIEVLGPLYELLGRYYDGCRGGFTPEEAQKACRMTAEAFDQQRAAEAETRQVLERKYAIHFSKLIR